VSNTGNVDWYSPFRFFYPKIQSYLTGTNPGGGGGTGGCAASKAFVNDPQVLQDLRALRDNALMQTTAGKWLVSAYYAMSPKVAGLIGHSPAARTTFQIASAPFAAIGGMLR
jgi:hypothetical protein